MNKYYKADDVVRAIAEHFAWHANRIIKGKNDCVEGWEEWVEDAKDVVYNLSAIEVSGDCISKAYLEQEIEIQAMPVKNDEEYLRGWNNALYKVVKLIEKAPSVVLQVSKEDCISRE